MADCHCLQCQLQKADDATLAGMERDLLGILSKGDYGDEGDAEDFELDAEDAEIMATLFSAMASEITNASIGGPDYAPTAQDLQDAAARVAQQVAEGMALLSAGAASRLDLVLGDVGKLLQGMVAGNLNAIQSAARMQEILQNVEVMGNAKARAAGSYSAYEWARLCRTEAAFARSASERQAYTERYDADFSAIDKHGAPPRHPHCLCNQAVAERSDGRFMAFVETTPAACEVCNDWADDIMAAAGL